MIIYRIQHETAGYGPLCGKHRLSTGGMLGWITVADDHDPVDFDAIEGVHYFGSHSKEWLLSILLADAIPLLRVEGFKLYTYEAEPCIVSDDSQVIFIKAEATLISIEEIPEKPKLKG